MIAKSNRGLLTHALFDAMGYNRKLARNLLLKSGVYTDHDWIPTGKAVPFLYDIEGRIGGATIRRVGASISNYAKVTGLGSTFGDFIENHLNHIYGSNHQHLSDGFQVNKIENGYEIILKDNPYPYQFNIGLVEGFSHHFLGIYKATATDDEKSILIEKLM